MFENNCITVDRKEALFIYLIFYMITFLLLLPQLDPVYPMFKSNTGRIFEKILGSMMFAIIFAPVTAILSPFVIIAAPIYVISKIISKFYKLKPIDKERQNFFAFFDM